MSKKSYSDDTTLAMGLALIVILYFMFMNKEHFGIGFGRTNNNPNRSKIPKGATGGGDIMGANGGMNTNNGVIANSGDVNGSNNTTKTFTLTSRQLDVISISSGLAFAQSKILGNSYLTAVKLESLPSNVKILNDAINSELKLLNPIAQSIKLRKQGQSVIVQRKPLEGLKTTQNNITKSIRSVETFLNKLPKDIDVTEALKIVQDLIQRSTALATVIEEPSR